MWEAPQHMMLREPQIEEMRLKVHGPPAPLKELKVPTSNGWSASLNVISPMVESLRLSALKQLNLEAWQNKTLVQRLVQSEVVDFARQNLPGSVHILSAESVLSEILAADPRLAIPLSRPRAGIMSHLSASTFFWRLYVDGNLTTRFPTASRLLVGNALLFALWKEEAEFEVMALAGMVENLPLWFGGSTPPRHDNSVKAFDHFCKGTLHDYMWESTTNFMSVISASSWSGLFQVCDLLNHAQPPFLAQNSDLRLYVQLLLPRTEEQMANFLDFEKRQSEIQYRLGLAVQLLSPQYDALRARARRVLLNDTTIDIEESAGDTLKGLLLMAERVQAETGIKERVLGEVSRLARQSKTKALAQLRAPETADAISTLAAATITGTVERVLTHVWESESVRLLIGVLLGARTGFYLSTQPQLISSLSHLLLSLTSTPKFKAFQM